MQKTVIEPNGHNFQYWKDLWRYKELALNFAKRDVTVRYKQTIMGMGWAIISPIVNMLIMTFIFGNVAGLASEGDTPYYIMVYAGLIPWALLSKSLQSGASTFITNADIMKKVYFPRILSPLGSVLAFLIDTAISFGVLLYNMQVVNGSKYAAEGSASVSQSTVKATRGEILDRNGKVLVGNRQGSAVVFDATKFPSFSEQEDRNKIILSLINLFEQNGDEWTDELPIYIDGDGNYAYTEDSEHDIEVMLGKDMLNLNRYASADDCMKALIERYKLENYSKKDARAIASVCYQMRLNAFNTANTYQFAEDVDDVTASYIKEKSSFYRGVEIEITTYREYYDGTLAPHMIGMVGSIDAEEYKKLKEKGYGMNDVVGKSGIELAMEDYLKGENGVKSVTVNSDGTTKVEYTKEVKNGDSIVLTLDADMQKLSLIHI